MFFVLLLLHLHCLRKLKNTVLTCGLSHDFFHFVPTLVSIPAYQHKRPSAAPAWHGGTTGGERTTHKVGPQDRPHTRRLVPSHFPPTGCFTTARFLLLSTRYRETGLRFGNRTQESEAGCGNLGTSPFPVFHLSPPVRTYVRWMDAIGGNRYSLLPASPRPQGSLGTRLDPPSRA
jgi:hypothetical protein